MQIVRTIMQFVRLAPEAGGHGLLTLVVKIRHKELPATSAGPTSVVDLRALCNAPPSEIYEFSPALREEHSAASEVRTVELAAGQLEIKYESEKIQGRQWVCRPRRDLCVMISALTRTPVLNYSMTGDAPVMVQLRLSGYAIHDEQVDENTVSAMITYFPPGTRLTP